MAQIGRIDTLGARFGGLLLIAALSAGCSKSRGDPPRPETASQALDSAPSTTSAPPPPNSAGPAPQAPSAVDTCARLQAQGRYDSKEELDCGPPLEGHPPPRCHSSLTFSEREYSWRHTDMVFSGTYSCEGLRIQGDDEHNGTYDPKTGHVHWEGLEYVPVPDK